MKLYPALGVSAGDVVAFAGAGGKSGAILAVAEELVRDGRKVLLAPTTKMFLDEVESLGPVVASEEPEELYGEVEGAFAGLGAVAVSAGSGVLSKRRLGGVEPETVASLAPLADVVLVEADGARRRLLKGTAFHEPALPEESTLVVAVGNIEALGKPVGEEHVHRPELLSALTGLSPGQSITARAFARALAGGSLGNLPPGARPAALITGVRPGQSMADASVVAHELWRTGVQRVVMSSLPDESPGQVWVP